jgi:hypothetical protein
MPTVTPGLFVGMVTDSPFPVGFTGVVVVEPSSRLGHKAGIMPPFITTRRSDSYCQEMQCRLACLCTSILKIRYPTRRYLTVTKSAIGTTVTSSILNSPVVCYLTSQWYCRRSYLLEVCKRQRACQRECKPYYCQVLPSHYCCDILNSQVDPKTGKIF